MHTTTDTPALARSIGDRALRALTPCDAKLTQSIIQSTIRRAQVRAMFDFTQGTQAKGWLFKGEEELGACLHRV